MAKVKKKYIDQLIRVWNALYNEAADAMSYVDDDNECSEKNFKVLDRLQDRFDKAIAHLNE